MIQDLKLKDIQTGENYRRHTDKAGMKELTASVKSHGVLQPIIVRKVGKGYELIAGHRRYTAASAAGLKTIPASVVTADDAMALEIAVIENSQREDPNPMDEAIGFKKLLDLGKHTPAALAKKLDKSLSYVYGRLKLNDLPKAAQKALLADEISYGHALVLTRFGREEDIKEMLDAIIEQDMSVKQAAEGLRDYSTALAAAVFDKTECENCPSRTRNQAVLFPEEKDTDDCMDQACYATKTKAHYAAFCDGLMAEGFAVVNDRDQSHKLMYQDRKADRLALSPNEQGTKPKDKKKCLKCKQRSFVCVEQKNYHGLVTFLTGWICMDRKCLEVMNGTWVETVKKPRGDGRATRDDGGATGDEGAGEGARDPRLDPSGAGLGRGTTDAASLDPEPGTPDPALLTGILERCKDGTMSLVCPECACVVKVVEDEGEGEGSA